MKQPNIVIVDYGIGNIFSVESAIKELGYRKVTVSDAEMDIKNSDVLILPGVGAFDASIKNLKERNLDKILNEDVIIKKKPILGICVGMQLMSTFSEENGNHQGLNWIPGQVVKLNLSGSFIVPHVGWNDLTIKKSKMLFSIIDDNPNFYFDHSYHYICDSKYVTSHCDYEIKIVASIEKENICGVQFHPEKSQNNGLKILRSFFNYTSQC